MGHHEQNHAEGEHDARAGPLTQGCVVENATASDCVRLVFESLESENEETIGVIHLRRNLSISRLALAFPTISR